MTYQVLARKWRPRSFADVTGQEAAVKALTHAIEAERLHHAYLFTGTRGVGKTTLARILAKAMNCLQRSGVEPCGHCDLCRMIEEGRCTDLLEVDAASRTRVEDTRDLLDNVQYAPSQARYKVYLIDEVHMLSGHSFNALLKTLEEPPAHVKFLLATTDPQKIPVTVLSRCLQLHLRRLSVEQICARLTAILDAEAISYAPSALNDIAYAADGSLRDALSLLDQAIAYGGGIVRAEDVALMLGQTDRQVVADLLRKLAAQDGPRLLAVVAQMTEHAANFTDALRQMLTLLQAVALAQVQPNTARQSPAPDTIAELAALMTPEDVQLYYQIALLGQRDLPLAPEPRGGFEMILLRMLAFRPDTEPAPALAAPRPSLATRPSQPPPPAAAAVAPAPRIAPAPATMPTAAPPVEPIYDPEAGNWLELMRALKLSGMTREFASHCLLKKCDDTALVLSLDPTYSHLRSERVEAGLSKALQAYFAKPIKLIIKVEAAEGIVPAEHLRREKQQRLEEATQEIERDPTVQAFKQMFDAQVVPGSIEPLD